MRILACSDLHRDQTAARAVLAAAADADILICAGDLADRGAGHADTLAILRAAECPILVIPGNHDDLARLRAYCASIPNMHFLHGTGITLGAHEFFGFGGEVPPRHPDRWNLGLSEVEAAEMLAPCPAHAVLITHTPPYGTADVQRDGAHEGSNRIRVAIKQHQPRLHLCGHIHHAWGTRGTIGATPVHNLGPTINWFTI